MIRFERPEDRTAVDAVHRAAFGEHGSHVVSLLQALREQPDVLSLLDERDGAIAGHVLFSAGWLDATRRLVEVSVLSPVGVLPGRQRRGVGAGLIRRGLELLDERGVPAVFLEGPPRYYRRMGFAAAVPAGFRKPSLRIPDEAFQVARLSTYEPWMTGTVVYCDAFWRQDAVGLRR